MQGSGKIKFTELVIPFLHITVVGETRIHQVAPIRNCMALETLQQAIQLCSSLFCRMFHQKETHCPIV